MINIVQVACDAGSCPESVQCPTHLIKTMNLSTSVDCCPSYYCGTFLQSYSASFILEIKRFLQCNGFLSLQKYFFPRTTVINPFLK